MLRVVLATNLTESILHPINNMVVSPGLEPGIPEGGEFTAHWFNHSPN